MAATTRITDIGGPHGCFPTHLCISGSSNVKINGLSATRVGDEYAIHCCPHNGCHSGKLLHGSSTVFVNGKQLGRIGDPISCGGQVITGSNNVFCG